ncbi:MAG TPA: hydroxyethylthiazole kinase [Smithella sp.]|nr:hydroxyethylthiazole kinase [Smithella sp.]MDM7986456.1 hydroxyethylthiazole kinase [Smithella sp.]HNY50274.1 hydroxyethylthiazole kinase [Smithella sp.]HOG89893.1 hydroxyethylthiazole kinase [Smithella sp.]HOU49807.1 hydroxyethylthiazole kinase [Smithella sp.]
MRITAEEIYRSMERIRSQAPVVHNITNYVVMNNTANALLAIGASPVMAHALEEVEDMVDIASALVINIGTLSEHWINGMLKAARQAGKKGIPIILDPVGAGATSYRTKTARVLLAAAAPAIIRGNASEIMALYDDQSKTKGVDSAASSDQAMNIAQKLSQLHQCVVCVSGVVDYVIDRDKVVKIKNGHPMMSSVTGLGCTASALCGAFAAVEKSSFTATVGAMAAMGVAGEMAAATAAGPGSMQMHFLDCLYRLSQDDLARLLKLEV